MMYDMMYHVQTGAYYIVLATLVLRCTHSTAEKIRAARERLQRSVDQLRRATGGWMCIMVGWGGCVFYTLSSCRRKLSEAVRLNAN